MILRTPSCVYTSVIVFGRQSGFATPLAASLTSGMGSAAGDTFATGNGANRTKSSVSDATRAIEYDGSFTSSSSESDDAAPLRGPLALRNREQPASAALLRPEPHALPPLHRRRRADAALRAI